MAPQARPHTSRRISHCAERSAKGVAQFQVQWASFDAKHNTCEPIEHLADCDDMLAEFKERKKHSLFAAFNTD